MRKLLVSVVASGIALAQTAVKLPTRKAMPGNGVIVTSNDGYKVADVFPGFSYFTGSPNAQLMSSYCSTNHSVSEIPATDPQGRYLLKARPNPASIAVYRGGVRLEPNIHFKLVYLQDGMLPDRFELTAAAPSTGTVIVDYFIGHAPLAVAE